MSVKSIKSSRDPFENASPAVNSSHLFRSSRSSIKVGGKKNALDTLAAEHMLKQASFDMRQSIEGFRMS
jgi:hypothetical protein